MQESDELKYLRAYLLWTGVPHNVTAGYATTGHASNSYHGKMGTNGGGLALDVAGPTPSVDSPALAAVYKALAPLGPQCAELIYAGPGGGYWKNGAVVSAGFYGAVTVSEHHNHVHIAVPLGWRWAPPTQGGPVPDATPDYKVNAPPVSISITPSGKGYIILCSDGGVFAFGDAPYLGRVHV